MKNTHRFISPRVLRALSLGAFCTLGAFVMGIETAGDVHPFARSEAAPQEILTPSEPVAGDADGSGTLDERDAYLIYQVQAGRKTPTADEVTRGDTDGDGRLTNSDLEHILRSLSTR